MCVRECVCVKTHIVGTSLDLLIKSMLILIPEWRVAHQQDVENHTCWQHGKLNIII